MAAPIAALTMYGYDWVRADIRAFWSAVAARLKDAGMKGVPARLTWKMEEEAQWRAPNLLLGQTCGYPLMKGLTGPVRLVATPTYDVPHCEGARYRSLVVVRKDEAATSLVRLRGRVAAVNSMTSHSGMNAFRRLVADYVRQSDGLQGRAPDRTGGTGFFGDVVESGSHLDSLRAVAAGKADVAAIDAVSFHLIARGEPGLADSVKILTTTLPAPGLPLITGGGRDDAELRQLRLAVMDTLADADARNALKNLGITGFQVLGREAYGEVLAFERQAEDMGYPRLA
jgi:ABC-type phosphate/phosphonate transport system substrate-binding protein